MLILSLFILTCNCQTDSMNPAVKVNCSHLAHPPSYCKGKALTG